MSEHTVLVIDDSATIRRLCDGELSAAGYRVLLAPTAEDGVATALEQQPNLIILDHQLPGTTGYEVACQLLEHPETAKIPVVASSTLRKKAYAEYIDCDNVVDMLPKPYSPEALIATVENAINTAEMVVQSQNEGSAVPEVINQLGEADLAGEFGYFGLREIIDLLNNGNKSGMLEVETDQFRAYMHVANGRIQAVTASGVTPDTVARHMPEALSELAPVVKFTLAGRKGSEVDGLVELLNNKVLDPRLLKKLLRLQAAVLLKFCFESKLKSFRFNQSPELPPLFSKLPLEASLLGLLVEGSLISEFESLPKVNSDTGYVRRSIRGQNLDRAGLSSRHMKLMSLVAEPISIGQMAAQLGWAEEEVLRVVHGFEMAELVQPCQITHSTKVFGVLSNAAFAQRTQTYFKANQSTLSGRIVRDLLGLKLLLRRSRPDILLFENSDEAMVSFVRENKEPLTGIRIVVAGHPDENVNVGCDAMIGYDSDDAIFSAAFGLGQSDAKTNPAPATPATNATSQATVEG
ncbi:MAG: response regulator [Planctomycetota bacterium]